MEQSFDSNIDGDLSNRILQKYKKLLDTETHKDNNQLGDSLADSTRSVQFMPSLKEVNSPGSNLANHNNYDDILAQENNSPIDPIPNNQNSHGNISKDPSAENLTSNTLNQITSENAKHISQIRQRAHEQISSLEKDRDAIIAQSRNSIAQLQSELETTKSRLLHLNSDHSRALQDIEQLRHVYETRQAGISDKLSLTERENAALKQEIQQVREEMRIFQEQQQKSFTERLRIAEQSQRAVSSQLSQKFKAVSEQLRVCEMEKLTLLKSAAADMCKLNDCIEGQRDRISQLKVLNKQQQAEVMILSHEKGVNSEQMQQNEAEICSLRRRNENLTRELLRVDKMIYGKYKK